MGNVASISSNEHISWWASNIRPFGWEAETWPLHRRSPNVNVTMFTLKMSDLFIFLFELSPQCLVFLLQILHGLVLVQVLLPQERDQVANLQTNSTLVSSRLPTYITNQERPLLAQCSEPLASKTTAKYLLKTELETRQTFYLQPFCKFFIVQFFGCLTFLIKSKSVFFSQNLLHIYALKGSRNIQRLQPSGFYPIYQSVFALLFINHVFSPFKNSPLKKGDMFELIQCGINQAAYL